MDPKAYTITVSLEHESGETVYVARVKEFPDVEVFEGTADDAYEVVLGVIEDLYDALVEIGVTPPEPGE